MQDKDLFPTGPMELPGEPSQTAGQAPKKPGRRLPKKALLVFLVLLLTAAAALGVVKLLPKDDSNPQSANQNTNQQIANPEPRSATSSDIPAPGELKTFKTDHPRVEFSYPSAWLVSETEDEGVLIESPEFKYKAVDGREITGNFRIYIRQGARPTDSPYIGSGVAIKPSEVLVYSQPAPGQRSETNLTTFGYDAQDHFAYFFIAGNYILQPGETLGPTYGQEPETYIIAGGYSSDELADDLSMQRVTLDYYASTNAYKQALEIVKSLKVL